MLSSQNRTRESARADGPTGTRTYVILDGLADPVLGRELSARWVKAGFKNVLDVAGQWAWLARSENTTDALTDEQIAQASSIARTVGLQLRDRVGRAFNPDNNLTAMRQQIVYEYRSRLATALMFGLPALALHYFAPLLASGSGQESSRMIYPWLLEMVLVAWVCVAAGFPVLWQAGISLLHLRATPDLLSGLVIMTSFVPSAFGVLSMVIVDQPWFGDVGPTFHASVLAVIIAVLGRWLSHRAAARLAGRAGIMLPHYSKVVGLWLIFLVAVSVLNDWRWVLAIGLVLPPTLSLGAIHPLSPSWSMTFPVIAFVVLMLVGPRALGLDIQGFEIETATGFVMIMTVVFVIGWRRLEPADDP